LAAERRALGGLENRYNLLWLSHYREREHGAALWNSDVEVRIS
jgi:hypothetical protein